MPQMMANAVPAAMPLMHGGSRGSMYKYPPMTMHSTQQQQQHVYQQNVQQQVPQATINSQPVLDRSSTTARICAYFFCGVSCSKVSWEVMLSLKAQKKKRCSVTMYAIYGCLIPKPEMFSVVS